MAALTALSGLFVTTPYGRFSAAKLGPTVPTRVGWVLMELPALSFYAFYFQSPDAFELVPLVFAAVWTLHYATRLVAFPMSWLGSAPRTTSARSSPGPDSWSRAPARVGGSFCWSLWRTWSRALATHRWYQRTFPSYPETRRALIPFVL